jgi:hypothetical protein
MSHTFATLEVSASTYDEVERLLREAGYGHAFIDGAIDMHGIGLIRAAPALKPANVVSKKIGDGPERHYLIGPQRENREEALADLQRLQETER